MPLRMAIVGLGKIACDEHVPAILADPAFSLVATAGGRSEPPPSTLRFANHRDLLREAAGELDAVAICTPPGPRLDIARDCLEAGLHVLLEKPPCATLAGIDSLRRVASARGRTLFAAWHSQFAPAVAPARAALAGRSISALEIIWCEDVRRWHPGQDWVFGAGGFGVFDPGINAFSIVSRLAPEALAVETAELIVPEGRVSPIAATLRLACGTARFDWRAEQPSEWTIRFLAAEESRFEIRGGGRELSIDGVAQALSPMGEYPALYAHFADLVAAGRSDVDSGPLQAVADAFLVGDRVTTVPFSWHE